MSYDVVIAGAGPAGITLALELAEAGLRIALIESGGEEFDADTQALADGDVTGNDAFDLTAIRLRMLGGTTNHWGGHCLPLDEIDFRRRPLNGMSGWPFDRATLLPYYERAHAWLRLGPFDYGRDIGAGIGPRDFLLPDETRIETVPLRLSRGPLRFGEAYGARLRAAGSIELQLNSNVVGLILEGDDRIAGVEVAGLDGSRRRVEGRVVVLACGAVETARQIMLANAAHGRSFGDAGGLLGGCYMDHPTSGAGFLHLAEPTPRKAYWNFGIESAEGTPLRFLWRLPDAVLEAEGLVNAQFFLIPLTDDPAERARERDARRADRALRSIAKWTLGRPDRGFQLSQAYCDFITNADAFAAQTWTDAVHGGTRARRVLLKFESEELPEPSNRVTLTDRRDALGLPLPSLHWVPGAAERDSMIRSATLIGQIAGAAGLGRMELEDFDRPFWGTTTSWHQLGTARMAANPREGVTDPDCRVHGTRNLFVASGAAMPTNGRANPTLTILALTIRLADHLKAEIPTL